MIIYKNKYMHILIYYINLVNYTNRFANGESAFHCRFKKNLLVIVYCPF